MLELNFQKSHFFLFYFKLYARWDSVYLRRGRGGMIYLEAMSWIFIRMKSPFLPIIKLPMQWVLSGKRRKEVTTVSHGWDRAARTAQSAWWGNCVKHVTFRLTSRVLDCKREMKILTSIYLGTRGRETFNLSLQFLFL